MSRQRLFTLICLLSFGLILMIVLISNQTSGPLKSSLSPALELGGKATQSVNQAVKKLLLVDDMDEKAYGDAIYNSFPFSKDTTNADYIYVNTLLQHLTRYTKKPFSYRLVLLPYDYPNAFALPGGIVMVTKGLLKIIYTEANLVSILAHEIGHIELDHCIDAVKFEIALKKIKFRELGRFSDFIVNFLLRHSFSKTQESDADVYAYDFLVTTGIYNPYGSSFAFRALMSYSKSGNKTSDQANLIRDYFRSHPPLEIRFDKYAKEAKHWWENNADSIRYMGAKNLFERQSYFEIAYKREWVRSTNVVHK